MSRRTTMIDFFALNRTGLTQIFDLYSGLNHSWCRGSAPVPTPLHRRATTGGLPLQDFATH
jgi:hypothetical protein